MPFLFCGADSIQSWWIWGYWTSPMMYGQNAIALNEFLDPRWNTVSNYDISLFLRDMSHPVGSVLKFNNLNFRVQLFKP